jgi:succinate dehydrogenase / fumarate reductase, flavoprotein subunit
MATPDAKIPEGSLKDKWTHYLESMKLVSPANKKQLEIIVVGTGIAGASAASALAELGYQVKAFCYQDSSRRAHSVAAQGGINAAKNYRNDGDSVHRLYEDIIKGGDYRAREANVYRAAEVSNGIIDQLTAQGVPFAREYGGHITTRSFGGVQVSRTFYAQGQTGQQVLLGAYAGLKRMIARGNIQMYHRRQMLELVIVEGEARGIIVRNLVTGKLERYAAHAVVLATGGYGTIYYLSTLGVSSSASAAMIAYRKGAFFGNPSFIQIHPTCIPQLSDFQSKLTLMSESLRNDGRIWVPQEKGDNRDPNVIPEGERDYYLERRYPAFGNLVPRDVASRAAKERCDSGYGVGPAGQAVYLDFSQAIQEQGIKTIASKYGNLFDLYRKITGDSPYQTPMKIYPAGHYTMGGLWVDYELMTTIKGLFAIGEANFSEHGANRLGASSLMQGAGDGYFILPNTIGNYLSGKIKTKPPETSRDEFVLAENDARNKLQQLLSIEGTQTASSFHKRLGGIMWDHCGMKRNATDLKKARNMVRALKEEFWSDLKLPQGINQVNQELEKAIRVADFFDLGQLLIEDALNRNESCGAHFREECQTDSGEALRDDDNYMYVAAWEYQGDNQMPLLHKEPLIYHYTKVKVRSYT